MDDMDKALDALKVQIKKEIVDNYFAERRHLEEDTDALEKGAAAYRQEHAKLSHVFAAFYAALRYEAAIDRVMQLLNLVDWPFYEEFRHMPPSERKRHVERYSSWGFTAWSRYFSRILDVYQNLVDRSAELKEPYDKVKARLRLLNEEIHKFNESFDFSLIAAQVEAMDGLAEPIGGGLLSKEREALTTRMLFKKREFTEEELPPPPALPPVRAVRGQFKAILKDFKP